LYEVEGLRCITATSLKEMLGWLGLEHGIDECRAMICRFDLNGDGVVTVHLPQVHGHDEHRSFSWVVLVAIA
jgi:hypothetical protein